MNKRESNDNDRTFTGLSVPQLCNVRVMSVQDDLTAKTFHLLFAYVALAFVIATSSDVKQWTIVESWILFDLRLAVQL